MKIARKFMLYVGGAAVFIALLGILFISYHFNSVVLNLKGDKIPNNALYLSAVEQQINQIVLVTGVMVLVGLAIFFIQLVYISRRIVAPLNKAVEFSNNLARGDFSVRLPKGDNTDEIGELIRSLNFMRDRLQNSISKLQKSHMREAIARKDAESVNDMKSDFLVNVSLELRNPLNSIMGFSSLILKDIENGLYDINLKTKIETIHESAETLNSLVTNLLELSKLDSNNVVVKINKCDTASLIRELADFNMNTAEDKNLSLENHYSSDTPPFINTDKELLFQILSILISVLIDKASPGRTISFGCKTSEAKVIFWVKDEKSPEPSPSVAEIYNRYIKTKPEQLPVGVASLLLNLTIAKNNALLLNAELKAGTSPIANSIFELIFNKDEIIPHEERKGASLTHTATNINKFFNKKPTQTDRNIDLKKNQKHVSILLAEDNEAGRMLVELALKSNINCSLRCVSDGVECMKALSESKYDLLILDLQMPNMDGHTVLRKLRQDPAHNDLPIIVSSAYIENSDKMKLMKEGASYCLIKPLNLDELISTVKNYI